MYNIALNMRMISQRKSKMGLIFKQKKRVKYISTNIGNGYILLQMLNLERNRSYEKMLGWRPSPNIHLLNVYNFEIDNFNTQDGLTFGNTDAALNNVLPIKLDLRTQCKFPQVYDQGDLGSCTANALAFLYYFICSKQKNKVIISASRLFIY